jgi:hypothetical protein
MNKRIIELAEQCRIETYGVNGELLVADFDEQKFAELIVRECLGIVKSNTYGPAGEYDYSYSDTNAAADERAETIHEEIAYHFGVES